MLPPAPLLSFFRPHLKDVPEKDPEPDSDLTGLSGRDIWGASIEIAFSLRGEDEDM